MRIYSLVVNDAPLSVKVIQFSSESAELEVNGKICSVRIEHVEEGQENSTENAGGIQVREQSSTPFPPANAPAPPPVIPSGIHDLRAPIPGLIMDTFVREGDYVTAGQVVLKMEAMKMENVIKTSYAGRVTTINVKKGDSVIQGQVLIVIE